MITSLSQLDVNKAYLYADYLTWRFDDMVELIKGKLYITSPAPVERHQKVIGNLFGYIWTFFLKKDGSSYIAPFDVRLIKNIASDREVLTVVQPDIFVICDQTKIDSRGCLGAPDLIVEILSPATAKKDMNERFNLYEENSVQEYRIVSPNSNSLDQYFLDEGKYERKDIYVNSQTCNSVVFPNLKINLEDIFYS